MMHQTFETPDMQLVKLLVARKLKESAYDIDPSRIEVSLVGDGDWMSQVQFRYPLRKLKVSILSRLGRPEDLTTEQIVILADEQVYDFQRIVSECHHLEELIAEAKRVAKREIAKINRRGTALKYIDVHACSVEAGDNWLPSPEVSVEILSEALLPERFTILAEDPSDIVSELGDAQLIRDQVLRASRRVYLDGAGAGGAIDRVALNVLRDAGHDVANVIGRLRGSRLGFAIDCGERQVGLQWDHGLISASFSITETASFHRDTVRFEPAGGRPSKRGLMGKRARNVIDSPCLEGMTIASAEVASGRLSIDLEPCYHLFDAETLEPRQDLFVM